MRRTLALLLAAACAPAQSREVNLCFRHAPELRFPGYTDSNSPAEWVGSTLRVFHGANTNTYTDGATLRAVGSSASTKAFQVHGGVGSFWLESTVHVPGDARLFGVYHWEADRLGEPRCGTASFDARFNLGVAEVGIAVSSDEGASWRDLGIVLTPPASDKDCNAKNGDFASGNGDPNAVAVDDYLYIYYGNYGGPAQTQGVSLARIALADLASPVGKALKWDGEDFTVPGLGGPSKPLDAPFIARVPYGGEVDSFWGPSISYNGALSLWVMLLNRTRYDPEGFYWQEGAYVSFSDDPSDPGSWTPPRKFSSTGGFNWYPELIGTLPGDTDKHIAGPARYFEHGVSNYEVELVRGALTDDCLPEVR